jgi:hypothetical protein
MRTAGLALAVVVMATFAGVEAVLAQDETAPSGAVWVTGTARCPITVFGTTTTVEGVEQHRGRVAECTYTSSDPRVAEPTTNTSDWDCYTLTPAGAGQSCWGWGTLESPNWTGYGTIVTEASGDFVTHMTLIGRGANAGSTFVVTDTPEGFSGLLYEGDPPPFQLTSAAASE